MKRGLRIILVVVVSFVLIIAIIGGGFGTKTNSARLNDLNTVYFAHRAGAVAFPENCLDGVERALGLGYDGVELDIHETSDQHFVLIHDDSCTRLLGIPRLAEDMTLDEMQAVPLRLNGLATHSRITTLDTVLHRYAGRLLFYLDTKFTGLAQADRLAALIQRNNAIANTVVASSSIPFLTYLEYRHPEVNTVLEGFDKGEEWSYALFPKNFRPDFLSSFSFETDSTQIDWLRAHGLLRNKIVYGMDSAGFAQARALGITRFIVDEGVPPIAR